MGSFRRKGKVLKVIRCVSIVRSGIGTYYSKGIQGQGTGEGYSGDAVSASRVAGRGWRSGRHLIPRVSLATTPDAYDPSPDIRN